MLTIGSAVLAVVNIGVMWGMAHRWRYAWHGNLGLQLLWLPYDTITKQYGLLALGAVMTVVSIKGCLHRGQAQPAQPAQLSQLRQAAARPRHRRPRRGWFGRRTERTDAAGRQNPRRRVRRRRFQRTGRSGSREHPGQRPLQVDDQASHARPAG